MTVDPGRADRRPTGVATDNDLTMLAVASGGGVSQRLGAVLTILGGATFDPVNAAKILGDRIICVPRLRQQLERAPAGSRPRWVEHPDFDVTAHIGQQICPSPGDASAVLKVAAGLLAAPFARGRPLWRAIILRGLADERAAVVIVVHHMMADGIGGLAVLDLLLDPIIEAVQAAPRTAVQTHLAGGGIRKVRRAFSSVGGLPAKAARCSLLRSSSHPAEPRQIVTVTAPLGDLRAGARTCGATINDAIISAVAGSLEQLLTRRGERSVELQIAVPISVRRSATADRPGNEAGVIVVATPVEAIGEKRLRAISARLHLLLKDADDVSPAAALGPLFRTLAGIGLYRRYLEHQHRFHTIVSDLAGPVSRRYFMGSPIESLIPLAVAELGNVTVSFVALSYAGALTVTITADPKHFPDLDVLVSLMNTELTAIGRLHETR